MHGCSAKPNPALGFLLRQLLFEVPGHRVEQECCLFHPHKAQWVVSILHCRKQRAWALCFQTESLRCFSLPCYSAASQATVSIVFSLACSFAEVDCKSKRTEMCDSNSSIIAGKSLPSVLPAAIVDIGNRGTAEVAQPIKCWLCKHEDLSVISSTYVKSRHEGVYSASQSALPNR